MSSLKSNVFFISVAVMLVFDVALLLSLLDMMVSWISLRSASSSNFRNAFLLLREKSPGDLICRRRKFPASAASGLCFISFIRGCCGRSISGSMWC